MSQTTQEAMEAAKRAVAEKDWVEARRHLAPVVADTPRGIGTFLLARAELELGRPEVAAPLVAAFIAWRPQHAGARLLAARTHLAAGALDRAERELGAARDLDPDRPAIAHVAERIRAARAASQIDQLISVVDSLHVSARVGGPSQELLDAARALQRVEPGPDWVSDRRQATIAYFHHAGDVEAALRNYDPHLIDISCRFGYATWPRRIQQYVRGRSVLDIGCGFGGFGMGFLIAGAAAYTGLDPAMDLDSSRAKDKRTRKWADMGVTPRQIASALPAVRLLQSSSEDQSLDETFDTIALHNVTEHLLRLQEVVRGLPRLCRRGSVVVFHHHNFYCWNGHHLQPNRPSQLDLANPAHREVYDWRHITMVPDLPADHYVMTSLNRVRLDELRAVVEQHFDIVRWEEIPSSPDTLDRLTPEVLDRVRRVVPDISERELRTNAVLGVARPKAR
jgi:SAM-dependent methyltransferase